MSCKRVSKSQKKRNLDKKEAQAKEGTKYIEARSKTLDKMQSVLQVVKIEDEK